MFFCALQNCIKIVLPKWGSKLCHSWEQMTQKVTLSHKSSQECKSTLYLQSALLVNFPCRILLDKLDLWFHVFSSPSFKVQTSIFSHFCSKNWFLQQFSFAFLSPCIQFLSIFFFWDLFMYHFQFCPAWAQSSNFIFHTLSLLASSVKWKEKVI